MAVIDDKHVAAFAMYEIGALLIQKPQVIYYGWGMVVDLQNSIYKMKEETTIIVIGYSIFVYIL